MHAALPSDVLDGVPVRPGHRAEPVGHLRTWADPAFLDRFDLSPAEAARLRECRRPLALVWLFLLAADGPDHPRNPPGTADRQAGRVLELLA